MHHLRHLSGSVVASEKYLRAGESDNHPPHNGGVISQLIKKLETERSKSLT